MSQSSMHCQQSSAHGGWTTGQQPPAAVCMVNPGTPVSPVDEAGAPPGCRASSGLGSSRTAEQGISMRGYLEDGRGRSLGSVPSCGRLAAPENAGAASSKLSNRFWNSTDSQAALPLRTQHRSSCLANAGSSSSTRSMTRGGMLQTSSLWPLRSSSSSKGRSSSSASAAWLLGSARPAKMLAFHHCPKYGSWRHA